MRLDNKKNDVRPQLVKKNNANNTRIIARVRLNAKRRKKAPVVYALRWAFVLSTMLGLLTLLVFLIVPKGTAEDATLREGVIIDGMDLSGETLSQARQRLINVLNKRLSELSITLKSDTRSYVLTAADMQFASDVEDVLTEASKNGSNTSDLNTHLTVSPEALSAFADKAAGIFDVAPIEPYAEPDKTAASPAFIFHEGTPGQRIDKNALSASLTEALAANDLNREITLTLNEELPTGSIDAVKSAIAQRSVFQTKYASGSLKAKSRIYNVKKGAELLNGCVLAAGEEFSFNDYIGPRTYDGGWESAPGIVNGNMYEMQAGGGICQVSTTLHNAVMLAGPELEVTLRKNHSWPSSYVDYGLDATVSTGGPDFKFKNNTASPIFIFAYADNVHYTMTVYIYGEPLPEGISYKVYATTDEVTNPGQTVIVEEPTWPVGKTEVTIRSRNGYKTTAYRDTIKDGQVVDTEVMYHYNYRAVRGETHVGTLETAGTMPPVESTEPFVSDVPVTDAPVPTEGTGEQSDAPQDADLESEEKTETSETFESDEGDNNP